MIVKGLHAKAGSIYAKRAIIPQFFRCHRGRIHLQCDLAARIDCEFRVNGFQNPFKLIRLQKRRRTAAEIDRVDVRTACVSGWLGLGNISL